MLIANELAMLSKLAALGLAVAVVGGGTAGLNVGTAGLATLLAAQAKLGMLEAMLLAMLSMDGGAGGAEEAGPTIDEATPANDGMLAEMMPAMPVSVGRGGGASSEREGGNGGHDIIIKKE